MTCPQVTACPLLSQIDISQVLIELFQVKQWAQIPSKKEPQNLNLSFPGPERPEGFIFTETIACKLHPELLNT